MEKRQLFGLFAHPAGHSLSPMMHNAAFEHLGLHHYYHAFDVKPEQLQTAVQALKALDIAGINVSIPHKETIMTYLDEIEEEAQIIGAVNTIVLQKDGSLKGYNTDGAGYVQSLLAETSINLKQTRALILGAGGAAKGIALYLVKNGCAQLTITNRSQNRAEQLKEQLQEYANVRQVDCRIKVLAWGDIDPEQFTLLINTTPKGMWPNVQETALVLQRLTAGTVVSDIVYNPLLTRFLADASALGAEIHQGLGMFVYQGVLAFEYFTGQKAPVEIMRKTVLEHLESK